MSRAIYPIAMVQFLMGAIISALNVLVLVSIIANRKLRTAPYFLLGNLWFANLLLGVIVMVTNVVDQQEPVALAKAEGTVSVMNCLATLATFLTISTARMVNIRTPHHRMALRSVTKILVSIWTGIFLLILVKSLVFTLDKMYHPVCYPCLLGFEAALLLIFATATVLIYITAMYMLCVHKKTDVHDASAGVANQAPRHGSADHTKEYNDTITLGVLLAIFLVPFVILVILLGMYTFYFQSIEGTIAAEAAKGLDSVAVEIILTVFYLHCIANPIALIIRDSEVRKTAKKLITCRRPNEDEVLIPPENNNGMHSSFPPSHVDTSSSTNNNQDRPITSPPHNQGPPPPYDQTVRPPTAPPNTSPPSSAGQIRNPENGNPTVQTPTITTVTPYNNAATPGNVVTPPSPNEGRVTTPLPAIGTSTSLSSPNRRPATTGSHVGNNLNPAVAMAPKTPDSGRNSSSQVLEKEEALVLTSM